MRLTEDEQVKKVLEQNQAPRFAGDTTYIEIYLTFISCLVNRKGFKTAQTAYESLFKRTTDPEPRNKLYFWLLKHHQAFELTP